jgi:hypothetical protein
LVSDRISEEAHLLELLGRVERGRPVREQRIAAAVSATARASPRIVRPDEAHLLAVAVVQRQSSQWFHACRPAVALRAVPDVVGVDAHPSLVVRYEIATGDRTPDRTARIGSNGTAHNTAGSSAPARTGHRHSNPVSRSTSSIDTF